MSGSGTLTRYFVCSVTLTLAAIYHALHTREQFYPAVIYLTTSKIHLALLGNMGFSALLSFGYFLKAVFLGSLTESEVERLVDRSRDAIMETCLAMTIFREEFNVTFVAMFVLLLFVKVFHWLVQDRVERIPSQQIPGRRWLFHLRITAFLAVLLLVDASFLQHSINTTLKEGPSVLLLFSFEYLLLAAVCLSIFVKYVLYVVDSLLPNGWETKGVYIFYLELVTDLFRLTVYSIFFIIVFMYYGLPLHLVRDLYWTFRNFRTRLMDFIRYRRLTVNLDKFPDATSDDLSSDNICIICREEMTEGASGSSRPKKLSCSHVFHLSCLRSWLERQQTCPTCRATVTPPTRAARATAARAAAAAAAPIGPPPAQAQVDGTRSVDAQAVPASGTPTTTTPVQAAHAQGTGVDGVGTHVPNAQAGAPAIPGTPPHQQAHGGHGVLPQSMYMAMHSGLPAGSSALQPPPGGPTQPPNAPEQVPSGAPQQTYQGHGYYPGPTLWPFPLSPPMFTPWYPFPYLSSPHMTGLTHPSPSTSAPLTGNTPPNETLTPTQFAFDEQAAAAAAGHPLPSPLAFPSGSPQMAHAAQMAQVAAATAAAQLQWGALAAGLYPPVYVPPMFPQNAAAGSTVPGNEEAPASSGTATPLVVADASGDKANAESTSTQDMQPDEDVGVAAAEITDARETMESSPRHEPRNPGPQAVGDNPDGLKLPVAGILLADEEVIVTRSIDDYSHAEDSLEGAERDRKGKAIAVEDCSDSDGTSSTVRVVTAGVQTDDEGHATAETLRHRRLKKFGALNEGDPSDEGGQS